MDAGGTAWCREAELLPSPSPWDIQMSIKWNHGQPSPTAREQLRSDDTLTLQSEKLTPTFCWTSLGCGFLSFFSQYFKILLAVPKMYTVNADRVPHYALLSPSHSASQSSSSYLCSPFFSKFWPICAQTRLFPRLWATWSLSTHLMKCFPFPQTLLIANSSSRKNEAP